MIWRVLFLAVAIFSAGDIRGQQLENEITNTIGMRLVLIPKGTFMMGSPPSEKGSKDIERQHQVVITQDYYMSEFEVTQALFKRVMQKNPSVFQGDRVADRHPETGRIIKDVDSSNHPVDSVSWEQATEFCRALSEIAEEREAGRIYRLPTEAEWEYACRGGTKSAFSVGTREQFDPQTKQILVTYGFWFKENSKDKTRAVGEGSRNTWGLFDMHGNVSEWCSDWLSEYPTDTVIDPVGPSEGKFRVLRGGSWNSVLADCRSASRGWRDAEANPEECGFRVVVSLSEKIKAEAQRKHEQMLAQERQQRIEKLTRARTWTDASGRFRVIAKFVRQTEELVFLEKEDGDVVEVEISRLSEADKKRLAELKDLIQK